MWVKEKGSIMQLSAIKEIDHNTEKVILTKDTIMELSEDELQMICAYIRLGYKVEVYKPCIK